MLALALCGQQNPQQCRKIDKILEIKRGMVSGFLSASFGNIRKLDYAVGTGPHGLALFVGNYHCSGITGITWVCVVGTMFHPLNLALPFRGTHR